MATTLKVSRAAQAKKYFQQKMAFTTGPVELERWMKQGAPVHVVDVRAAEDYARGHIPGSVNLPKDQWGDKKILKERLRKDKNNVLYCYSQVCHLAATGAVEFTKHGFPAMELEGGWKWWAENGFNIEK